MSLPPFFWLTQRLFSQPLPDIAGAVSGEMARVLPTFAPGAQVAVTAGSRGVANIALILRSVCQAIRAQGGEPFLVPAMGSHGGATAEGQVELLASLGVTEESVGAPIRATMEVERLGVTPGGTEVVLDRNAFHADGIVVVGRVKPHTDFTGRWESGLAKMMAVGLGKEAGATRIHRRGAAGLREAVPQAAELILARAPVVAGLAVLEDARGQTWRVVGVTPAEMLDREAELLEEVKAHTPRLPFPEADLLIVDYLGKDVSGTGLDTKVIGRMRLEGQPEPSRPRIRYLAALDLTEASHGNANGLGLADVITERLLAKTDLNALRVNASACGFWERAKVPVAFPNDARAIEAALRSAGVDPDQARVCRIRDTLRLERMVVSRALVPSLEGDCELGSDYTPEFDSAGNLADHDRFPNLDTAQPGEQP
ncbi:MAG: lactate racemase domain-containing protein [Anaerolineae bacterium]